MHLGNRGRGHGFRFNMGEQGIQRFVKSLLDQFAGLLGRERCYLIL